LRFASLCVGLPDNEIALLGKHEDFALNPYLAELNDFTFTRLARLLADVSPPAGLKPINLSIGEPKHPTPQFIPRRLSNTAADRAISATEGPLALRQTIAD
jgi:N-succinyldiaminopimelate aminotransferase